MIDSGRRAAHGRGGFTLMEIVMVLAIAVIILGGAMAALMFQSSEKRLREASSEIEAMAKRAHTVAILQQKPYALVFLPGKVRILPLAETIEEARPPEEEEKRPTLDGSVEAAPARLDPVRDEITLHVGITSQLRRWSSDEWTTPTDKRPLVWKFTPDGLSEPVTLRLDYEQSWLENTFHPLTASVADSSSEFR